MSKYGNHICYHNGIKFHSKAERWYYTQLLLLEKAKEVKILKLQPKFLIEKGFVKKGKKYQDVHYIADFEILDLKSGLHWVIDVKGMQKRLPREYILKRNKFLKVHNRNFREVYIKNYKITKIKEY